MCVAFDSFSSCAHYSADHFFPWPYGTRRF
jgi:hypothetical protein